MSVFEYESVGKALYMQALVNVQASNTNVLLALSSNRKQPTHTQLIQARAWAHTYQTLIAQDSAEIANQ